MDTVDPPGVPPGPAIVPPWRPPLPAPLAQPRSNCDSGCLPLPSSHRPASRLRRAGRVVALIGAMAGGLALLPFLPFLTVSARHSAGRRWARAVLTAAGVRLVVRGAGTVPRRRALLVANHNSWLDTVALLAVSPARMTAKHDIRHWPVIGVLAALAGTIFIDRRRPRQLPATVARIADALREGGPVAVFPAGTTGCGTANGPGHRADNSLTGRWRPAVFQAAVDANAIVVPIRLAYRDGADGADSTIATFLSAESLLACVLRVIAVRGLVAVVTVEPALHPGPNADRRVLARAAEGVVRPRCHPVTPPAVSGAHVTSVVSAASVGSVVSVVSVTSVVSASSVAPTTPTTPMAPMAPMAPVVFASSVVSARSVVPGDPVVSASAVVSAGSVVSSDPFVVSAGSVVSPGPAVVAGVPAVSAAAAVPADSGEGVAPAGPVVSASSAGPAAPVVVQDRLDLAA